MKFKFSLVVALLFMANLMSAQESSRRESNFHLGIDLQTKYIWRGMEMMTEDAAPVIFPCLNYSNSGCNSTYTGATVTDYNVPTHRSTAE